MKRIARRTAIVLAALTWAAIGVDMLMLLILEDYASVFARLVTHFDSLATVAALAWFILLVGAMHLEDD